MGEALVIADPLVPQSLADVPDRGRLLTIPLVAELAHVHRSTESEWIGSGALRSVKVGKARRVPLDVWLAFVDDHLGCAS